MVRSLFVIGTLILVMMAGARPVLADEPADEGLASLMDETALAVARIDISADEPGAMFASLMFGDQLSLVRPPDWPNTFRKLLTAANVKHIVLVVQIPTMSDRRPTTFEAICVIPTDRPESAEAVARLAALGLPDKSWRVATRGKYCLLGPAELIESALSSPRPQRASVETALAAAGDAPLAVVIAPSADQRRVLTTMLPQLPAADGGDILRAWATDAEWTTLAFVPEQSFRIIVHADSPARAAALATSLQAFLKGTISKVRSINGQPAELGTLVAAFEQSVTANDVVLTADLKKLPPGNSIFRQAADGALQQVRRREAFRSLKLVGLGMHNYHDVNKRFPDTAIRGADGKPLLSWRVQLLPYLDQKALYDEFHLDEPWDSEHNRKLIERMPEVYRMPTGLPQGKTAIVLPIGAATAWPNGRGLNIREFIDGTSKTIMAVEADDEHAVTWTQPADLAFDPAKPTAGLGSRFGQGFLALSADGAAHFLPLDTDPETLRQLFTPAGKEPVSWPGR